MFIPKNRRYTMTNFSFYNTINTEIYRYNTINTEIYRYYAIDTELYRYFRIITEIYSYNIRTISNFYDTIFAKVPKLHIFYMTHRCSLINIEIQRYYKSNTEFEILIRNLFQNFDILLVSNTDTSEEQYWKIQY